jgi:hypothetical protein
VQPPVLDTCTQRGHVITVWRQAAYRQADRRGAPNSPRSFDNLPLFSCLQTLGT